MILVGNTPPDVGKDLPDDAYVTCAVREGFIPASASEDIMCNPLPVYGQYVIVHKPNTTFAIQVVPDTALTLCEVEVYAAKGMKYIL